jgi:hypothetical protein
VCLAFLPFEEAKAFVHKLGLKTEVEWRKYCKSGEKPDNIPSTANGVYYKEWKGWGDWLGTGKAAQYKGQYMSFQEARKLVQSLSLKSQKEWNDYCKLGKRPKNVPANPYQFYKSSWRGWGHWLGSNRIANQNKEYYSFTQARKLVHSLGLKSRSEWRKYVKSGNKPDKLPSNPSRTYKQYWKGFGDWLGTGTIAVFKRQFRSFENARKFARSLNLKSQKQWAKYSTLNKLPADIPTTPSRTYKSNWKGWGDWLGTYSVANQEKEYRNFAEAREFVRSLGLNGKLEWEKYCKSGKKPVDIPYNSPQAYKNEWTWWADWLGYEGHWNLKKIKELLRDLIKSQAIYQWSEAVLYSLLLRKGLLNLGSTNRHDQFFKNLLNASKTEEGRKIMEKYAYSDEEMPPDISNISSGKDVDILQEVQTMSISELASDFESSEPLDYENMFVVYWRF